MKLLGHRAALFAATLLCAAALPIGTASANIDTVCDNVDGTPSQPLTIGPIPFLGGTVVIGLNTSQDSYVKYISPNGTADDILVGVDIGPNTPAGEIAVCVRVPNVTNAVAHNWVILIDTLPPVGVHICEYTNEPQNGGFVGPCYT